MNKTEPLSPAPRMSITQVSSKGDMSIGNKIIDEEEIDEQKIDLVNDCMNEVRTPFSADFDLKIYGSLA